MEPHQDSHFSCLGKRARSHHKLHGRRRRSGEKRFAHRLKEGRNPHLGVVELGGIIVTLPSLRQGGTAAVTVVPVLDFVPDANELEALPVLATLKQRSLHGRLAKDVSDLRHICYIGI